MRGKLLKVAFVLMFGASVWADGWEITGSMNCRRAHHTATLLSQPERVLVLGEMPIDTTASHAEYYDPMTKTWTFVSPMRVPRAYHGVALSPRSQTLFVAGGNINGNILDSYEIYDIASDAWTVLGSMTVKRDDHTVTWATMDSAGTEVVVIAGGYNHSDRFLQSWEMHDPVTGAILAQGTTMSTPRGGHTATLLPNGKILVAGGSDGTGWLSSCELFDPTTQTWTVSAATVTGSYHTVTLLDNGKVLFAGKYGCQLYDYMTDAISTTGDMITPRWAHTDVLLSDGRVLATGGNLDVETASCEIYDPVTGTWQLASSMNEERAAHSATLLSDGTVLVAGGTADSSTTTQYSCELWDADGTTDSTGGISGIVWESDSVGKPIQGAYVHAFECAGFHEGNAYTDQRGGYTIDGLEPGSYYVEASAGGFVHEFYDDALELGNATPVDVLADQITPDIDFMLDSEDTTESEHISGTVVDEVGDPLSCLIVAFKGKADFFVATTDDSTGQYSVEDVGADTFYVYAWAPGYIAEYYDNAIAWDDATGVIATADDVDFALAPATKDGPGGISGTITSTGKDGPVGDAMVYAMTGDQAVGCARSWADGRYAIDGLNAGTYTIRATRAFYGTADYATLVEVTEGTVPDVDIVIPETGVETSDKGLKTEGYLAVGSANPTIGGALISYHIPVSMHAALKVYNASGALVKTLVDGHQNANSYSVRWNGRTDSGKTAPSGVYFCRLQTNDFRSVVKINLVR